MPARGPFHSFHARRLPDDWFEHDGQITKREICAITLSSLRPVHGQLLWDVGAGSGSIGIEWMLCDLSCPDDCDRGQCRTRRPHQPQCFGVRCA